MSDNPPENARFGEFGSTDIKGYPIQISGDLRQSKLLDEWTMLEYNPYSYTCGTDGWDPSGTAEDYKSVNKALLKQLTLKFRKERAQRLCSRLLKRL